MRTLIAGVILGTIWVVDRELLLPAMLATFLLLVLDEALLTGPGTGRPDPYDLGEPEEPRHRRGWGWSFGIGLTHLGPLPFITLYRRPR